MAARTPRFSRRSRNTCGRRLAASSACRSTPTETRHTAWRSRRASSTSAARRPRRTSARRRRCWRTSRASMPCTTDRAGSPQSRAASARPQSCSSASWPGSEFGRSTTSSSTRSGSRCPVERRPPNGFAKRHSPRVSICGIATTARSTWRSTKRRMRPVWRPSSRRLPQERARPRRRSTDQWTALRLTIRVVSRGPPLSSRIRCSTGITRKRR